MSKEHAIHSGYDDPTMDELENMLMDVYLYSQCEYLVCTMSSNIGRIVFEMWSAKFYDLTDKIYSLDDSNRRL
jgi:hypothetical protein